MIVIDIPVGNYTSGALFYIIELLQYINDVENNLFRIRILDLARNFDSIKRLLSAMYTIEYEIINKSINYDTIICTYSFYKNKAELVNKYKYVIVVATDSFVGTNDNNDIILLIDNRYKYITPKSNTINIKRCVYPKYWKLEPIISEYNNYFFSYMPTNDLKLYTYIPANTCRKVSEFIIAPHRTFKGLIYNRIHDYMPRLPIEFWYMHKPVYIQYQSAGIKHVTNKTGYVEAIEVDLSNFIEPHINTKKLRSLLEM